MRDEGTATSLAGLLQRQSSERPDAPALVDVARTWTWQELEARAAKLRGALRSAGVRAGDRVGVHCNKGADGFIAMHAAVGVGAVAVPLDPGSPTERLSRVCSQMGIEHVVTHPPRKATADALREGASVSVLGLGDEIEEADPLPPTQIEPDSPAYIITTSGSTGEPKGMVHTHRSALAYANMTLRTYGIGPDDRISDIAAHHFDISTMSLWSAPLAGATNVVVNEAYQRLPASHSQLLEDEAVTIWYSVPFLLHQLVLRGDLGNRDLSALRWVHFGGEVISPQVIAEMMTHCPNARFGNIFGPAETNQCSLAIFDSPPDLDKPLSVGFPLDHSDLRAIKLDADTPTEENEVGSGQMGEMWAHTPQLMDGYWNNPATNAHVFKKVDGKRFYRTGDLISIDEHGELSFYGRVDHQIKVRGYRIELEGIELQLEELDSAEHVVVGVLRAHSGEDELVAGLLGTPPEFNEAEFLNSAASVLPSYAVPTRTVRIDTPKFTGSGKLDRRVLREDAVAILREPTS